jgi:hypothetical protein
MVIFFLYAAFWFFGFPLKGEGDGTGDVDGDVDGDEEPGNGLGDGDNEGLRLGDGLGLLLGLLLELGNGLGLGLLLGLGLTDGLWLGLTDGLGLLDGVMDGLLDGAPDGTTDELPNGLPEGLTVGLPEGTVDGLVELLGDDDGIDDGIDDIHDGDGLLDPSAFKECLGFDVDWKAESTDVDKGLVEGLTDTAGDPFVTFGDGDFGELEAGAVLFRIIDDTSGFEDASIGDDVPAKGFGLELDLVNGFELALAPADGEGDA